MRKIGFAATLAAVAMPVSVHAEPAPGNAALPTVVYGAPPQPYYPPTSGYVLDPSDARRPIYVVNQGPVFAGPGIYTVAVPTYSEGGYAYANPYPYIPGRFGYRPWRHVLPYVGHAAGGHPVKEITVIAGSGRPHGPHPRHAYHPRPAAGAKVIRAPGRGY